MYAFLLYLHILSAMLALGPFFILIPLMKKMQAADFQELQHHLDSFHSAVRLSKHSGHVLVGSGVLLAWLRSWPWSTPWIVATVAILFSSLFFIARAFSPTIRKLRSADLTAEGREPYLRKLFRSLYLYIALLLIMLWLMVAKPTLWLTL
jgi:uncharacterized membrane protein